MRYLLIFISVLIMSVSSWPEVDAGTIPPEPESIMILGDSLTSGLYATSEQSTFVSLIGEYTGMKIAREHGSNLDALEKVWEDAKVWNPDIIVVEIGLNDVSRGVLTDSEWKERYLSLIRDMKESGAKVISCTMFWAGIKSTHPKYNRYLRYNEIIEEAARENETDIVDLWSATENCTECVSQSNQISYFAPGYRGDNFHPSDLGHKMIALEILKVVMSETYLPVLSN